MHPSFCNINPGVKWYKLRSSTLGLETVVNNSLVDEKVRGLTEPSWERSTTRCSAQSVLPFSRRNITKLAQKWSSSAHHCSLYTLESHPQAQKSKIWCGQHYSPKLAFKLKHRTNQKKTHQMVFIFIDHICIKTTIC
jgi:hypothetical protein